MVRRRSFLRSSLVAGGAVLARPLLQPAELLAAAFPAYPARVIDLVACTTVIDMLGLLTMDWAKLRLWEQDPAAFGETDLLLLRASGINVFHPAVDPNAADPRRGALRWMKRLQGVVANQRRHMLPILSTADLDRVRQEGLIGIVLGLQSSNHFQSASDVAEFHALGQRVSQLTYDERCRIGSGCRERDDLGLTDFGASIVAEMDRVGMAIDLSHCSERTTLEAMELSRRPVLITHANCHGIAPHPRNKSDRVLRELRARDGVIGLTSVRAFVRPGAPATLEHLLDHFDHAARVAGIEHVGLGSDCDVDPRDPHTRRVADAYAIRGLSHPRRTFDIAAGLLRRGYSESDVALVLGGNFRRVLDAAWTPGSAAATILATHDAAAPASREA